MEIKRNQPQSHEISSMALSIHYIFIGIMLVCQVFIQSINGKWTKFYAKLDSSSNLAPSEAKFLPI